MGLAEDGTVLYDTKNIEDIEVGDLVYSYDTITGEYGYSKVTSTAERESAHINSLTILDEQGNEQTIDTTDSHPFWVVSDEPDLSRAARSVVDEDGVWLYHENINPTDSGYWVEAKDLRIGDVFLGADGKLSTLTNAVRVEQSGGIAVFNFTVEGNHDYFVLAKNYDYGQTCVLVHNAGACSTNAEILRKNMITAGKIPSKGDAAHHIVASTSEKFAPLRQRLIQLGIESINDADNGVFLQQGKGFLGPGTKHASVHTKKYLEEVTRLVENADVSDIRSVLQKIGRDLQLGIFPY